MNKRRKQSIWLRRNLPLLIAAAALVLLVLIIVLVARGCSKGSDTVIRAKAFSTGTTIELPLSAELNESDFVSYGGYQFTTKKKLSALSKLITKNNEGITAETYTNSYGECGVYTKTNESGGTDSWCLYVKDPKNTNEKWYFFMGEHREIALDSGTLDLLLPLHLITDASLRDTMFAAVQPGTPYTCGIDKLPDGQTLSGMFRAFYEASGLYTVTTSDKGFTLVPRGGAQELMFQFDEQDTNGQFMITVPQAAEPQPSTSAVVTYGSDDPVSLSESDAAALSTVLLQANYKKTGKTADYRYSVDLGGDLIPLPKEKTADGKLDSYVGKKVKMGIRPEDIDDEPEFMAKHPDCHLETQVDVSEMMGAEIYLYLEYKGNKMTARVAPTSKARNGDTVRVAFDPHKVHVFDVETEQTILN